MLGYARADGMAHSHRSMTEHIGSDRGGLLLLGLGTSGKRRTPLERCLYGNRIDSLLTGVCRIDCDVTHEMIANVQFQPISLREQGSIQKQPSVIIERGSDSCVSIITIGYYIYCITCLYYVTKLMAQETYI
jgi:hypothetical protein